MPKIFRYEVKIADSQIIDMPMSTGLLSVAPSRTGYAVDLWALVPEEAPMFPTVSLMIPVTIRVFGTGHPLPKETRRFNFIGTCVMDDGYIWHVFEEPDPMSVKP